MVKLLLEIQNMLSSQSKCN